MIPRHAAGVGDDIDATQSQPAVSFVTAAKDVAKEGAQQGENQSNSEANDVD